MNYEVGQRVIWIEGGRSNMTVNQEYLITSMAGSTLEVADDWGLARVYYHWKFRPVGPYVDDKGERHVHG